MSRTMHLGCKTCKEHIWVGQNNAFYSGEPHTMEGLRLFLIKHRTGDVMTPNDNDSEIGMEHELIYTPELYEEDWAEVDTDRYKDKNDHRRNPS